MTTTPLWACGYLNGAICPKERLKNCSIISTKSDTIPYNKRIISRLNLKSAAHT